VGFLWREETFPNKKWNFFLEKEYGHGRDLIIFKTKFVSWGRAGDEPWGSNIFLEIDHGF